MHAASATIRRQHLLIRCFLPNRSRRMHSAMSIASLEVDALRILRAITPPLDPTRYKGQAGKIAVIGGCREYTGAPYFSAVSALKIGADLSHVFCTKDAAPVIKGYSPELIVHPILEESYSVRCQIKAVECLLIVFVSFCLLIDLCAKNTNLRRNGDEQSVSVRILAEVMKWMERFDCLVIGPGLGRDPFLLDGLFLITNRLELIKDYSLAVLTPNVMEYKRLVQKVLNCEVNDGGHLEKATELLALSKGIGGVTILRKGRSDLISDGETGNLIHHVNQKGLHTDESIVIRMYAVRAVSMYGSPRRCGGQGDILSGGVAVFLSWARQHASASASATEELDMNPTVLGCIAGSTIMRKAAWLAFEQNRRSTVTADIINCLGRSLEEICPTIITTP